MFNIYAHLYPQKLSENINFLSLKIINYLQNKHQFYVFLYA